jgi:1,4-alpha-glucan branching enzyme
MISKSPSKTGQKCRVTFKHTPTVEAETVAVLGEFNDWEPEATPLAKRQDGSYSATLSLDAPGSYRFRYLLDGKIWENEGEADGEERNRFGSKDSVIEV